MNAYIYLADIYCAECGEKVAAGLRVLGGVKAADFPQGPHADGGGESDVPQHCANCGVYLEAPLTDAGMAYAIEALGEAVSGFVAHTARGRREPLETWAADLKDYTLEDRQAAILALYFALPEPEAEQLND